MEVKDTLNFQIKWIFPIHPSTVFSPEATHPKKKKKKLMESPGKIL